MLQRVSPGVAGRAIHPAGGRVRFRTDSPTVTVRTQLRTNVVDWAIPLSGSAGADVYIGRDTFVRYAGVATPRDYESKTGILTFEKKKMMEDITIHLPRNEELEDVLIELEDGSRVEAPSPYLIKRPMVFYGSSITEGGCATRAANAYTALLSKWLDADYLNLGFSGSARGETELAEYIGSLEMSAFICDYDHNAPHAEHLENTHEPFFRTIRAAQPDLPILILSKPDFDLDRENAWLRRRIIYQTWDNARASGDRNVYFIDGESFFGEREREACTVDGCHPNDLGFMRMAETIYPVLKRMLDC
jgi:lysophospholipase L1-like esterase